MWNTQYRVAFTHLLAALLLSFARTSPVDHALSIQIVGQSSSDDVRIARAIVVGLKELYGAESSIELASVDATTSNSSPGEGKTEFHVAWGPELHQKQVMHSLDELRLFVRRRLVSERPLGCIPPHPTKDSVPILLGGVRAAGAEGMDAEEEEQEAGAADNYDLIVIGGGSGGLACAKEASRLGAKVACLDYVKPSQHGTAWGLGGTCVNVGCIPKKLMHQAAMLGKAAKDMASYGWSSFTSNHDWSTLISNVSDYIHSLNFKHNSDLWSLGIDYLNMKGQLDNDETAAARAPNEALSQHGRAVVVIASNMDAVDESIQRRILKGRAVVIAVGGRPRPLECEGGHLAISSDDLFSLPQHPGRTLVVGASYVALECAGFLTGIGCDVTVMARSILLRGFDQGCAEIVGQHMEKEGTRFVRPAVPNSIRRLPQQMGGRLQVNWTDPETQVEVSEEFDTVLSATGRVPETSSLGLTGAGISLSSSGKIIARGEQTTNPKVYAIGDCVEGNPELTPLAIAAGVRLARRLFGGHGPTAAAEVQGDNQHLKDPPDLFLTPTTIFTPLEYGCCGMTEEQAIRALGDENVEVYHAGFSPLEWKLKQDSVPAIPCYVKVRIVAD
jgi:thioredoxin/glutathione reductase (selenoprotein)